MLWEIPDLLGDFHNNFEILGNFREIFGPTFVILVDGTFGSISAFGLFSGKI